jgi:hypothetical protein
MAGNLDEDARRSEEVTGAKISWHLPWQPSRWWTEGYSESQRHGGCAKARGARPWSGRHRRAHLERSWRARYGGRSSLMTRVYPRRWDLLHPECYPVDPNANHGGEGTNLRMAHRRRGTALAVWFDHCTMEFIYSWPDIATWSPISSWFHVTTWSFFCTKVAALSTVFIFVIASLTKILPDHT